MHDAWTRGEPAGGSAPLLGSWLRGDAFLGHSWKQRVVFLGDIFLLIGLGNAERFQAFALHPAMLWVTWGRKRASLFVNLPRLSLLPTSSPSRCACLESTKSPGGL